MRSGERSTFAPWAARGRALALSEEVERLVILTHELGPLRNRGVHVGGVDLELARPFLTTLGDEGQRGLFARLAAGVARLRS